MLPTFMEDMDEYMRCLDDIAFTNHIEDADEETCLVLPIIKKDGDEAIEETNEENKLQVEDVEEP
jgi:hypothetical protein